MLYVPILPANQSQHLCSKSLIFDRFIFHTKSQIRYAELPHH